LASCGLEAYHLAPLSGWPGLKPIYLSGCSPPLICILLLFPSLIFPLKRSTCRGRLIPSLAAATPSTILITSAIPLPLTMASIFILQSFDCIGLLTPVRQVLGLYSPAVGVSSLPLLLQPQIVIISLLATTVNWHGISLIVAQVTALESRSWPELPPGRPKSQDTETPWPVLPLDNTDIQGPSFKDPSSSTHQNTSGSTIALSSFMTSSLIILIISATFWVAHPIIRGFFAHLASQISSMMPDIFQVCLP
jgi:hypothetical protein